MANEYLRRTPTSTGNRRVWTWSAWIKRASNFSIGEERIWTAGNGGGGGTDPRTDVGFGAGNFKFDINSSGSSWNAVTTTPTHRDPSSWSHIMFVIDTTQTSLNEQRKIFFNGVRELLTSGSALSSNELTPYNLSGYLHVIGSYVNSLTENPFKGEMVDVFFVDGQALTPDVFGFYKQGKGYISAGSTQSTDFRPGQWVPKTPRVIKTEINRRGGFGVNGFYLPMNDNRNFGADFHGDPNSIITLNEKLPQPRVGVATTASVGLGYTDALRADPYAANLVLALPFVSGGLQSGFGDYAPSIKGSGTAKSIVSTSATIANVSAGSTSGLYYGSGASFSNSGIGVSFASSSDFGFGTGDYTVECWIHRSNASSSSGSNALWTIGNVNSVGALSLFYENTAFMLRSRGTGDASFTNDFSLTSSNFSTQQWNHFAVCRKGTTVTLYVNGVSAGISTISTRNVDTNPFIVGSINSSGLYPFFGFIQDLRVYKGVAKYTTGFDVPRPYTPVGIATWRAVPDCTANNFATLNPLIEARPSSGTDSPSNSTLVTFAGGNLDLTNSASSGNAQRMYSFGTIGISTGRWYWEVRGGSNDAVAISKGFQQKSYGAFLGSGSGIEASVGYYGGGTVSIANTAYYSTATTLTPPTFDTTNIIGIAVSANSGLNNLTVQWFKDGVGVSTVTGIGATSPVLEWFPSRLVSSSGSGGDSKYNFGQNPTFSGNTTAGTFTDSNGKGLFKYQPPSGFLALCEDNLPTPAISDPGKYFKTVLYTGDGNSGRSIVGVGFTPDLVWIKNRSNAASHIINDSVRGAGFNLFSNSTAAENGSGGVGGDLFQSFNSDGFAINPTYAGASNNGTNASGQTYAAWCWRAGAGTTSTNTNGSITSVVSVNQDAGFSIVSYRGTGANATVGHGLGKAPSFMVFKQRNQSDGWLIYHKSITARNFLQWDTDASAPLSTAFNNTEPTSSVFSVGTLTNANDSGWPIIAYCWAEIEGFSKFGSYVGNGNADGPMVWCGFKPAWIMIKRTAGAADWVIHDSSRTSVNPSDTILRPNTNDIDLTAATLNVDFLSNGFKIRNTNGSYNNAETYIFAAFAESPINYSNSK